MDDADIMVRLPAQVEIYSFLHIVLTSSVTQGPVHCVPELGQDPATIGNKYSRSVRNVEFRMSSDAESSQKNGLLSYTDLKKNLYLGSSAVGDTAGRY
jgi:hypothetical protein